MRQWWTGLTALCAALALPLRASADELGLRITVVTPQDREMIAAADGKLLLVGQALAYRARSERFDLMIAIDISQSAGAPTGADVDGDGDVGYMRGGYRILSGSDDPGDTVLAAQILAARTLVSQLDPFTTRVGLVAFAGDGDPGTPDASVVLPLTGNFALVGRAFDFMAGQSPRGRTNISAAIDAAVTELRGEGGRSKARADATRVMLLMTDGQPTLPYPSDREASVRWTVEAGQRAAVAGVRIDSFAIGEEANRGGTVLETLSKETEGRFTAVQQPAELVSHFEGMRITTVEQVAVRNRTTGAPAERTLFETDGRFSSLVDLTEGENVLELSARDTSGKTAVRLLLVSLLREGSPPTLYPRWAQARTRILESRLEEVRERRLELQAERERALATWMREESVRVRERSRGLRIEPQPQAAADPGSARAAVPDPVDAVAVPVPRARPRRR